MTTSADSRTENYPGAGSTGPFTFNFPVGAASEITVTKYDSSNNPTLLSLVASSPGSTEYTNTLTSGGAAGGSVTLGANLAVGETLTIQGATPLSQAISFVNQGAFFAEKHETAYDKLTRIVQEISRDATRSLKYSPLDDDNNVDPFFPPLVANSVLIVNATADGFLMGPTSTQISSAETYASNASDSADAAALSESAASDSADLAADWASKTDGIVDATDYSAKAFAIGGTGVTNTAGRGAAKEWATKAEDSTVDGTEYSAKHYAAKAQAAVGGVVISANDTTPGNLETKILVAGSPLSLSTQNDGGDETLTITLEVANQAEAEAGTITNKVMTPQQTAQAIAALSGGWKTIKVKTASNDASIDFVNGVDDVIFDGTYKAYRFIINNLRFATDNVDGRVRLGNGGSVDTGGTDYGYAYDLVGGTSSNNGAASFIVLSAGQGNDTGEVFNGEVIVYDPAASECTYLEFIGGYRNVSGAPVASQGMGYRNEQAAHDYIRFYATSGDIASGSITLQGLVG